MEPKQRIADIEKRLRDANSNLSQIKGRHESAQENVAAVESECRERKIDPDKIDEVISALKKRFDNQATKLETDLAQTEKDLAPFLGETS